MMIVLPVFVLYSLDASDELYLVSEQDIKPTVETNIAITNNMLSDSSSFFRPTMLILFPTPH
jgi:hypothetical protein